MKSTTITVLLRRAVRSLPVLEKWQQWHYYAWNDLGSDTEQGCKLALDGPNVWWNEISILTQMMLLACKHRPPEGWEPTLRWHKSRVTALYKRQQASLWLFFFFFFSCACERVSELCLNTHLAFVLSPGPEAGNTLVQHKWSVLGKTQILWSAKGSAQLKLTTRTLSLWDQKKSHAALFVLFHWFPNLFHFRPLRK